MSDEQRLVMLEVLRDHIAALELECVRQVRDAYDAGFKAGQENALATFQGCIAERVAAKAVAK